MWLLGQWKHKAVNYPRECHCSVGIISNRFVSANRSNLDLRTKNAPPKETSSPRRAQLKRAAASTLKTLSKQQSNDVSSGLDSSPPRTATIDANTSAYVAHPASIFELSLTDCASPRLELIGGGDDRGSNSSGDDDIAALEASDTLLCETLNHESSGTLPQDFYTKVPKVWTMTYCLKGLMIDDRSWHKFRTDIATSLSHAGLLDQALSNSSLRSDLRGLEEELFERHSKRSAKAPENWAKKAVHKMILLVNNISKRQQRRTNTPSKLANLSKENTESATITLGTVSKKGQARALIHLKSSL